MRPSPRSATATLLLMLAIGLGGCASAGSTSGESTRRDANAITLEELSEDGYSDVLTVIQRLRPRWLQTRGSMSFGGQTPARVVIDDRPQQGGLERLRAIRAIDVAALTYMNAADATTRYGMDMGGGAIILVLKR